ncbi:aminotransferase class V-fold PLP-dependent enzyme [Spirosoma pulveris]
MQYETTTLHAISRLRADTPGCYETLFLNNAGASLMPQPVVAAMQEYLQQETQLGGYEVERLMKDQIESFYEETARFLNTKPGNIAYAYSATDATIQALSAIRFRPGDTILTTTNDYISNQLMFLSMQQRLGIRLLRLNDLPNGDPDLTHAEELIRAHRPVLIAMTHIPTNSGLVLPAEEMGKLCRKYGIWYLLDAAQSVGQLPIDVTRIQADFLVATGRKFLRGPRNTGFLYVSDRVLEAGLAPLFIDRRAAAWTGPDTYSLLPGARQFEPQEISLLTVGLAEAIRYVNKIGMEAIVQQNQLLMHRLRTGLAKLDGLALLDEGSRLSNILTFHTPREPLSALEASLRRERVIFTVQYSGGALIDFRRKGVDWLVRLSPHYFNTLDEMDEVVDVIARFLR